MSILSAASLLFVIMDPFGNMPLFMSILRRLPQHRRFPVLIRELLFALAILLFFLFFGQYFLRVFHISPSAMRTAGGVVLFLIGIKMIFPTTGGIIEEDVEEEPFIVPLAIPLLAGPSTMATLVLLASQEPERKFSWLLALLGAWVLVAAILLCSDFFARILGNRGMRAIERLMGMVLAAVSIDMILLGISEYWIALTTTGKI